MKKSIIMLALVCLFPFGSALAGCGESFLCCEALPDYYVSNATCTGTPPNQVPVDCEYTPCPDGGGTGGPGGGGTSGSTGCDPNGGAWWVGCDPFAT